RLDPSLSANDETCGPLESATVPSRTVEAQLFDGSAPLQDALLSSWRRRPRKQPDSLERHRLAPHLVPLAHTRRHGVALEADRFPRRRTNWRLLPLPLRLRRLHHHRSWLPD